MGAIVPAAFEHRVDAFVVEQGMEARGVEHGPAADRASSRLVTRRLIGAPVATIDAFNVACSSRSSRCLLRSGSRFEQPQPVARDFIDHAGVVEVLDQGGDADLHGAGG